MPFIQINTSVAGVHFVEYEDFGGRRDYVDAVQDYLLTLHDGATHILWQPDGKARHEYTALGEPAEPGEPRPSVGIGQIYLG